MDDSTVNYQAAHQALDLTQEDRDALNAWLISVFPDGWSDLTDEAIIMRIYQQMMTDDFEYVPDIGDQWASISQFLNSKSGDCEEYAHLFYSAISMVFESNQN